MPRRVRAGTRGTVPTCRYYQPYAHHTQLSDIVMPAGYAANYYCMLMGAKSSASSSTLALAAIVDAKTFDDPTSLNSPRYSRGVYWHMTDGTLTVDHGSVNHASGRTFTRERCLASSCRARRQVLRLRG